MYQLCLVNVSFVKYSSYNMFCLQEHLNFVGTDDSLGPLLLSVKSENVASQEHMRLLLRLQSGTMHELVPSSVATAAPHNMVKVNTFITPSYHAPHLCKHHTTFQHCHCKHLRLYTKLV